VKIPRALLFVLPLLALASGCGVDFSEADPGTEFFTSLEVTGDLHAGQPLTAFVQYEQYYPVEVQFQCELRKEKTLIKEIGKEVVAPLPGGDPDATPFPGSFSFDFTVDEPARDYFVECLTGLDDDNFIRDRFDIAPAAETTPAATIAPSELGLSRP
jgi:hypothetical protein